MASVPLIVGYVGGIGERSTKRAFAYSAVFAVGTAITFISLGIIATSAGRLIGNSSPIWYLVLGALMVLMALQTWGVFNLIPSANLLSKSKKKGICRRISRRNIRRYIFLALFHSCFNCTTCHCCGKRKSAMGYSAYAAILNRS